MMKMIGCTDSYHPDPRIAAALAGGDADAATRWVTMDTYFYTLDHFLNTLDWHRTPSGQQTLTENPPIPLCFRSMFEAVVVRSR